MHGLRRNEDGDLDILRTKLAIQGAGMRIAIVALDGSMLSAVSGLTDIFWMTNQALRSPAGGPTQGVIAPPGFSLETQVVSLDGQPVCDPAGKLIQVDAAFQVDDKYDAVVIAGMALGDNGLPPPHGLNPAGRKVAKAISR